MKIGLAFRNEIMGLRGGSWIVEQFDSLVARISGVWQVEHNDDGTHADVTASSVDVSGNVSAATVTVNDAVTLSASSGTLSTQTTEGDVRFVTDRATFIEGSIILGVTPSALLTSQTLLKYAGGGAQGGLAVRRGDDSGAANMSALGISGTSATLTAHVTLVAADPTGIRLDVESGVLAVREGDDSAYALTRTGWVAAAGTYTDGDTTPTVAGVSFLSIANTGATTITDFDDGVEGQVIVLTFTDANTTVNRTNCYLAGGANFVSSASGADTLTLINVSGLWREISRSANS